MAINHNVVVVTDNNPDKEVSKNAWNADHVITGLELPLLETLPSALPDTIQIFAFKIGTSPNQQQILYMMFPNGNCVEIGGQVV